MILIEGDYGQIDQKIRLNKLKTNYIFMKIYDKYKENPLWWIIEKSLKELEKNQDITITTNYYYVVWYILKKIEGKKLKVKN